MPSGYPGHLGRRHFLRASGVAAATVPYCWSSQRARGAAETARPGVAGIGLGGRGRGITQQASKFGRVLAVCDVDRQRADAALELTRGQGQAYGDYRRVLDRPDIDVVIIGTPDHWHTKITIEALQAGKDVYCEKPLTLTIQEGKQICQVAHDTGGVVQVGTQQRSEFGGRFLQAVALIRAGRIGQLQRVVASTGGGQTGGPFAEATPPPHLDWDRWLGQAPRVPYIPERCHANFRWWREYAGGQMTDWGAHHVDIALWAIGLPTAGELQIAGSGQVPDVANGYNMPAQFDVTCRLPDGLPLQLVTGQRQGILFEGDQGRFFVNRGGIHGKPIERLADDPLPENAIRDVYGGKQPGSHMGNFFDCVQTREQPISDVFSHHRSVTVLHLANLCLLLGRPLTWDLAEEQILGDEEANAQQRREQRKGYEIVV